MDDIRNKLLRGEIVVVGNKMYQICDRCKGLVQINKFLFGGLHSCVDARQLEENTLNEIEKVARKIYIYDDFVTRDHKEIDKILKPGKVVKTYNSDGSFYGSYGCVFATQIDLNRQLE